MANQTVSNCYSVFESFTFRIIIIVGPYAMHIISAFGRCIDVNSAHPTFLRSPLNISNNWIHTIFRESYCCITCLLILIEILCRLLWTRILCYRNKFLFTYCNGFFHEIAIACLYYIHIFDGI